MNDDSLRVDGNAAAGVLSELFATDLTAARAKRPATPSEEETLKLFTDEIGIE